MRAHRRALLADAAGTVVEPAAGTGLNLDHYGPRVDRVLLLDPSAAMRAELRGVLATRDDDRLAVADGTFERIPLPDAAVDVVVATFVLCSVADPPGALREASPLRIVERSPYRGPRQPWPVRPGVRIVAERA